MEDVRQQIEVLDRARKEAGRVAGDGELAQAFAGDGAPGWLLLHQLYTNYKTKHNW